MKVTGYQLREALRQHELKLKTLRNQFEDSLTKFDGEDKPLPTAVSEQIIETEKTVCRIQEAQARYNLAVTGTVLGEKLTLCFMVKSVGGAGANEAMWRHVAAPKKDRYALRQEAERDPTKQYAKPQVDTATATKLAAKAAKYAGQLRDAIAVANGTVIDLEIDPKLFE